MTKQVAYKVLSEFWCWYGDVVKTVSRFSDDEHELAALDEVGEHSFDGLPLPSLDSKFFICGKEFEVRDALSLATMTVVCWPRVSGHEANPRFACPQPRECVSSNETTHNPS